MQATLDSWVRLIGGLQREHREFFDFLVRFLVGVAFDIWLYG